MEIQRRGDKDRLKEEEKNDENKEQGRTAMK